MKILLCRLLATAILLILLGVSATVNAQDIAGKTFDNWTQLPEYTVFNPLPVKDKNCTWYAHGRLMQLGFCKYALESMLGNAGTWQGTAARGTQISQKPQIGSIAFWKPYARPAGEHGHVGVVEAY